jgi:hypothetical protein
MQNPEAGTTSVSLAAGGAAGYRFSGAKLMCGDERRAAVAGSTVRKPLSEGEQVSEGMRGIARFVVTAGRTCRLLWTVRAAIPWPVRVILGAAMIVKCAPVDFGIDEVLTAVAVLVLNRARPGLMKACWRAAQVRA